MKRTVCIVSALALILGFLIKSWLDRHPDEHLVDLLTPNVFDHEIMVSVISYGVQNALATVLILLLFSVIMLSDPIEHLFIAERRIYDIHEFEARYFWQTLMLIPLVSLPLLWVFYRYGIFKIYFTFSDFRFMVLQLVAMVIIHDTYFYWCHRLLHTKPFRKIHAVHHRMFLPTFGASHVFHAVETFINYTFVVWFALGMGLLFGRIYYLPVMIFSVFTICWNIYGHGRKNRVSEKITKSRIGRYIVWPECHLEHHRKGKKNFEFFFTFWDELCGTRA